MTYIAFSSVKVITVGQLTGVRGLREHLLHTVTFLIAFYYASLMIGSGGEWEQGRMGEFAAFNYKKIWKNQQLLPPIVPIKLKFDTVTQLLQTHWRHAHAPYL